MCLAISIGHGQETVDYSDLDRSYKQAQEYFYSSLYGQARQQAEQYLNEVRHLSSVHIVEDKRLHAELLYHISGLRLDMAEGLTDLVAYVNAHRGNPLMIDGLFELGDHYYNAKDYKQSIAYFDRLDPRMLSEEKQSEMAFKKGYCHFVQKEFAKAKSIFLTSRDVRNKYFYPVNYYYGMTQYFGDDYEGAVKSFQRVENSTVYSKYIPYYISQIYFAQKKYDRLITYGERAILDKNTRSKESIRLLLGQTYFQRGDYDRALPHLVAYEEQAGELTVEEFYQLAFAQYKMGQYENAIENFLEISREDTKLGQLVNYYLADAYEKTGDLTSARAAFKKVSQMSYEKGMQEEATFNYGKLSSQMGFDREAVNVLMNIKTSSPYYRETQSIINDILVNSSDYDNSITILESLPSLNAALESTYQDVTFRRGIQLMTEAKVDDALALFKKADTYPINPDINTQIAYWRGYVDMARGNHSQSLAHFDTYFRLAKQANNLPEESASFMAHYNQGYNHLKIDEYYFAVDQFQFAINQILANQTNLKNPTIVNRVLPDAYVRAGDCLFKERKYVDAKRYYDGAINQKKGDFIYALYQRALIEGLEQDQYNKILTLEEITENYPESDYADDALLLLGDAYYSTGNPKPAAKAFQKLIRDYKGKSNLVNRAYLKLGLIVYNAGDAEQALDFYKQVFNNNPNPQESQEALIAIQEIYIDDLAKGEEFIAYVDSLPGVKIDAFARDSINFKVGENKYNNAAYDEAIIALDKYLTRYNQGYYRLDAHYLRGESHAINKNYLVALNDYESIIAEGISDYYGRALKKAAIITYNYTQNFSKSFDYYKKLEEYTNTPDDKFQAQLGAMRSAFRLSKDNELITYASQVSQNPLSSSTEKSTALYYLGKTYYKKGQLSQARNNLQRVSDMSSNNQAAEARYLIGKSYFDQGDLATAEKQIEKANNKNKAYPFWIAKNLLLMSDIFIKKNDLLNARAAVEAVIENFKDDATLTQEANTKLAEIKALEEASNRIKTENADGTLQLDTTGN